MELTANGIILYHIVKKSSYSIQLFQILFPTHFLDGSEDSLRKKIIALSVNQTSKLQLVKMVKAIFTVQSE